MYVQNTRSLKRVAYNWAYEIGIVFYYHAGLSIRSRLWRFKIYYHLHFFY
ncbi:hypothetical protein EG68_11666 [Paragonimus skrjabini miyazakii]|uniref:Uncharacterized protein n=1 Tax=Paragonimus skrjabini miyazakii TaxID=59628 RepID=A0A8S9YJN8_9TREM|nr:hypothetical protein EG68_11666 [Paragonimus skrjabini miyazakii]